MPEIEPEDSEFWIIAGPRDERTPVFAALGAFVSFFASVETMLHMFIRQLSGMDDGAARLAFFGIRNDDLVKRISDITKYLKIPAEQQTRLQRIFEQFRRISEMRNRLMHQDSNASSDRLLSIGRLTAKSWDVPLIIYNLADLRGATYDLSMMYQEIGWIAFIIHPELPTLPSDFRYQQFLTYTWQYKPPEPYHPRQLRPEAPQ